MLIDNIFYMSLQVCFNIEYLSQTIEICTIIKRLLNLHWENKSTPKKTKGLWHTTCDYNILYTSHATADYQILTKWTIVLFLFFLYSHVLHKHNITIYSCIYILHMLNPKFKLGIKHFSSYKLTSTCIPYFLKQYFPCFMTEATFVWPKGE